MRLIPAAMNPQLVVVSGGSIRSSAATHAPTQRANPHTATEAELQQLVGLDCLGQCCCAAMHGLHARDACLASWHKDLHSDTHAQLAKACEQAQLEVGAAVHSCKSRPGNKAHYYAAMPARCLT